MTNEEAIAAETFRAFVVGFPDLHPRSLARRQKALPPPAPPAPRTFGKKPPLRQQLMHQNRADRVDLLMRPKIQCAIRHRLPYADRLIHLAGISRQQMLKHRLDGFVGTSLSGMAV